MLLINGVWTNAENNRSFESTSPSTGESLGFAADASAGDLDRAISAARSAADSWAQVTPYRRAGLLNAAAENVLAAKDEIGRLMSKEQGKPLRAAINEIGYAADFLTWYSEEAKRIEGTTIPSARADQRFVTVQAPVGVVAAITPWNYPVSMITRKLAPAVAAGCTLVLKPAEATPLCAVAMFEAIQSAGFPDGVINLITVSDPVSVGKAFTTDPRIDKITFTGSTAVGRLLAGEAAKNLKRISMELGGHAPFIVFPDADPVHAAKGASLVKFLNAGQACISPNRIFVHRSIYQPFIETLSARTSALRVGDGLADGVSVGPLVNPAAVGKVQSQVDDAISKGATAVIGGHALQEEEYAAGHFFAPTVLSDVTADMVIYREETFGPVAAVIQFDDDDDIYALANDTHYGLAAYVYTRSISKMYEAMERLRFGIIGINDINPTSAAAPFGGMNNSGLGREGGREGIVEYLETKTVGISVA
ncbi:MAG: NAD-dependent succinate-semialdehyde dehydrogenase [Pseudomonadota bacterium]